MKQQKIYIIAGIVLAIIAVTVVLIIKKDDYSSAFNGTDVFSIIDAPDTLVYQEDIDLTPEQESFYYGEIDRLSDQLQKVDPTTEEVEVLYGNIALYERYIGEYQSSVDAYMSALEIEPKNRILWVGLSETLIAMKAYKSAEASLKKGIELVPGATDTYDKLARLYSVYLYPDNLDTAKEVYQLGLDTIIGSLPLRVQYAEWLGEYGFIEEAIEQYEQLKTSDVDEAPQYQIKIDRLTP